MSPQPFHVEPFDPTDENMQMQLTGLVFLHDGKVFSVIELPTQKLHELAERTMQDLYIEGATSGESDKCRTCGTHPFTDAFG